MLVVDNGENRNLSLGLRNLKGVTLLPTNEVNAFHLLGHKSVLLSEAAAAEILGGARKMNIHDVLVRPLVTEKGVNKKENERTLVLRSRARRQQDAGEGRGREAFQGEGGGSPHRNFRRQAAPPRTFRRLPFRLEEGLREA